MLVGDLKKTSFDEYDIAMVYDAFLAFGEYLSGVNVQAFLVSDDSDVSSTLLANTGSPPNATLVSGTATGGSVSTLIDTSKNFATLGVRAGQRILNTTKKFSAVVKAVKTTTNAFDTVEYETQSAASGSGDAYYFGIAKASVKAGTSGARYYLRWRATTSTGRKLEDVAQLRIE